MEQKPKGKLLDWLNHHPFITIVMIIFVIGIIGVTAETISEQGSSATSNSDLQATVGTTNEGISITCLYKTLRVEAGGIEPPCKDNADGPSTSVV